MNIKELSRWLEKVSDRHAVIQIEVRHPRAGSRVFRLVNAELLKAGPCLPPDGIDDGEHKPSIEIAFDDVQLIKKDV